MQGQGGIKKTMNNNPEKYPVCVKCPHYKSVANYECEVKAYGKEYAYKCKYDFVCGRVYNLSKRMYDKASESGRKEI